MKAVALLLLTLLAGCHRAWVQPGRTASDANRDEYECVQEAAAAMPGPDWFSRGDMRDRCMRARGYEYR